MRLSIYGSAKRPECPPQCLARLNPNGDRCGGSNWRVYALAVQQNPTPGNYLDRVDSTGELRHGFNLRLARVKLHHFANGRRADSVRVITSELERIAFGVKEFNLDHVPSSCGTVPILL